MGNLSFDVTREELIEAFSAAGLGPAEKLPVAHELGETSLMFLVHPTLSSSHIERMAQVVSSVMQRAST